MLICVVTFFCTVKIIDVTSWLSFSTICSAQKNQVTRKKKSEGYIVWLYIVWSCVCFMSKARSWNLISAVNCTVVELPSSSALLCLPWPVLWEFLSYIVACNRAPVILLLQKYHQFVLYTPWRIAVHYDINTKILISLTIRNKKKELWPKIMAMSGKRFLGF